MKISVCMAAYNGERYIKRQVVSILSQLSQDDELVIVNDCSTDTTLDVLKSIGDVRIKITNNDINLGVVKSFEKSIDAASGEIIFLSDQDDIWMPDKVNCVTKVFSQNRNVTIVVTDAMLIDEEDKVICDSYFAKRGKFNSGLLQTFMKNKYLGCTLAFRREMLDFILPFPADIPMHDIWIGVVNDIFGEAFYIDKPLIKYRRHQLNVTNLYSSGNIKKILSYRIKLFKSIVSLFNKNKPIYSK